jgi:serine phosphatase RsbU (regulator of sigma subunit)
MTVIAYPPGSYYYYVGLILVLMWAYTSTAARFIYATSAGWTLVMVYEIVAYGYSHTPLPILISNTFFFLSANIIGMPACYLIELYKRRDFLQRKVIEDERFKSETLLEEIHDELTLASEIQKGLLPPPTFTWDGGELVSCSRPTLEIGGDFSRYRLDENGRFILAVGDVSGHGIPAALLMAATLTLFDTSFTQIMSPGDRLSHLDEELLTYAEPRHQNCAFCYMELEKHVMRICNAGGIPPYIHRHNGTVEVINAKGFPLGHGFGLQYGYTEIELRLSAGDLVILMSDGVVEAKDIHNQMFGFNRLKNTIADSPAHTAQAMLEYLVNEVTSFTDIRQVQDDFTIVVVQVN